MDDYLSLDLYLEHRHGNDIVAALADASLVAPQVFAEFVHRREDFCLDLEDFAADSWHLWVGHGDTYLGRDVWRALFDAAGYRVDGAPAERPDRPLVLWRGATPDLRGHWSWTPQYDAAHMYASSWYLQHEVGLVWRAEVEPERLLARLTDGRRTTEYIVDTDGLAVEPHSLWCRCPVDLAPFRGDDRAARLALDLHELVDCPRAR